MARTPRVPGGAPEAERETAPQDEYQGETAVSVPAESEPDDYQAQARTLRAAEVDPTRLRRAVLTVDGWVCPAKSPAPPAKE